MERRRPKRNNRPSLNYAQHDQPVDVTVLTERSFLKTLQDPEMAYRFNENTLEELTPQVEAFRSRWPDGLVVIVAEVGKSTRSRRASSTGDMHVNLKQQLHGLTGRRFPMHIIDSVVNERPRQPYVPGDGGGVRGNAAWVLKYRGGNGVFPNFLPPSSDAAIDLLTEATWVGAWVGCREAVLAKVPGKSLSGDKVTWTPGTLVRQGIATI